MKKTVLVINGSGGVGKDTLCDMAAARYRVCNVSSITPIKEIAALCGWDGGKEDRDRKFLAELKALTTAYSDYPTRWILEKYRAFMTGEDELMFVHIREGSEIAKFVAGTEGVAKTLLIRGGARMAAKIAAGYGNAADDSVEEYTYDYVYTNDLPLEETAQAFLAFLAQIVGEDS